MRKWRQELPFIVFQDVKNLRDVYMFSFSVPNFSNRSPFVLKHKTPSKSSIHLGTGAAYSSVLNLATKKYIKASSCPSFFSLVPSSHNRNGNSTRHTRIQPENDYTRHPRALGLTRPRSRPKRFVRCATPSTCYSRTRMNSSKKNLPMQAPSNLESTSGPIQSQRYTPK